MARKKTIKVRQELKWHIASLLLQTLDSITSLRKEQEYQKRLFALTKYVNSQIEPTDGSDILDCYAVMEHEVNEPSKNNAKRAP